MLSSVLPERLFWQGSSPVRPACSKALATYCQKRWGSLSCSSRESQAIGPEVRARHWLTKVVLPNPAGANTRLSRFGWPGAKSELSRSRCTALGSVAGLRNLVVNSIDVLCAGNKVVPGLCALCLASQWLEKQTPVLQAAPARFWSKLNQSAHLYLKRMKSGAVMRILSFCFPYTSTCSPPKAKLRERQSP